MRTSKKQAARERERAGETSSLTGVGGESIGECDHHDDDESVAVAVTLSVELLPPSPPPATMTTSRTPVSLLTQGVS